MQVRGVNGAISTIADLESRGKGKNSGRSFAVGCCIGVPSRLAYSLARGCNGVVVPRGGGKGYSLRIGCNGLGNNGFAKPLDVSIRCNGVSVSSISGTALSLTCYNGSSVHGNSRLGVSDGCSGLDLKGIQGVGARTGCNSVRVSELSGNCVRLGCKGYGVSRLGRNVAISRLDCDALAVGSLTDGFSGIGISTHCNGLGVCVSIGTSFHIITGGVGCNGYGIRNNFDVRHHGRSRGSINFSDHSSREGGGGCALSIGGNGGNHVGFRKGDCDGVGIVTGWSLPPYVKRVGRTPMSGQCQNFLVLVGKAAT